MDKLPMILNTETMAELLNVSDQTVRAACNDGTLPAVKVGRRWFVSRDLFIEFLNGGERIGE